MKMPAIKGKIGNWIYYAGLMTFSQINEHVTSSIEEIYPAQCLNEALQRSLTDNYKNICRYLVNDSERFFNALILAVYDGDPQWLEVEFPAEEAEYTNVGFLQFSGKETIFPVDGQHRVEGIKHAIIEAEHLKNEQVPVIFIGHKQTEDGRKRTRKLFSTINRRAKPVGQNENIALDEDDVCSIITRQLLLDHPLFRGDNVNDSKGKQIPTTNKKAFTSLITLYQCVYYFIFWKKTKEGIRKTAFKAYLFQRPNQEEIDLLYDETKLFFNSFMRNTPAIKEYVESEEPEKAAKYRNSSGGNLLFRPIALTEYIHTALNLYKDCDDTFDRVFEHLCHIPLEIEKSPWSGLLWDGEKIIGRKSRTLIQIIIQYLADDTALTREQYNNMCYRYSKALNITPEEAKRILRSAKL